MKTIRLPPALNSLLLQDPREHHWLHFESPVALLVARSPAEVLPVLNSVQREVETRGLFAAGFLSYEAAPALDATLTTKPASAFPLAWFGLYPPPQIIALPARATQPMPIQPDWQPSVPPTRYAEIIARIKHLIQMGHTYQVNYTLRLQGHFGGDSWGLFQELIRAQPLGFGGYLNTSDWAICSVSPELFFEQQGEDILCRPMKGTAPRGLTADADSRIREQLRQSEKNRAENLMIVDMTRNDLGRIAQTGTVAVERLFQLEKYPTLWQMTTTVRCRARAKLSAVFQALFPPASVTGAPKRRTMEIIAELEETPREIYTGTMGFLTPQGRAQFNVAIRTVLVHHATQTAQYGVGGGIVWDSQADEEYQECQVKARILNDAGADFDLLESLLWTPAEGYFLRDRHLHRLSQSADYFDFPANLDQVQAELNRVARQLPPLPHKVRVRLGREGLPAIEAAPVNGDPPATPLRIQLAKTPVASANVLLYHKTTERSLYEKARRECPQADDVLLWNEKGELTEASNSNVVVMLAGKRYTPPVACGLLNGTYRQWLLDRGMLQEKIIRLEELTPGMPLQIINSVRKERDAILLASPAG